MLPTPEVPDDATRADIGLVCALPLELHQFISRCSKVKTYTGGNFTFRGGFYGDIRVAIVESGPGCSRGQRATLALLDAHRPRWVISTGFCGALVPGIKIGQVVVSNKITMVGHDELTVDIGMAT